MNYITSKIIIMMFVVSLMIIAVANLIKINSHIEEYKLMSIEQNNIIITELKKLNSNAQKYSEWLDEVINPGTAIYRDFVKP